MTAARNRPAVRTSGALALLVAAVLLAACGREEVPPGGPPETRAPGSSTPDTHGGPATTAVTGTTTRGTSIPVAPGQVVIQDYDFTPRDIEVAVGGTVTWVNQDQFNHYLVTTDRQIDSGLLTPGATYAKTFTAPGTYDYFCDIHNYEKGTVTVR